MGLTAERRRKLAGSATLTKLFALMMSATANRNESENARSLLGEALTRKGWHPSHVKLVRQENESPDDRLAIDRKYEAQAALYERQMDCLAKQLDYVLSALSETDRAAIRDRASLDGDRLYRWNELADLAWQKLGKEWRQKLKKVLSITPRRLELWETCKAFVPDLVLEKLEKLPDSPEPDPEPAPPPEPEPTPGPFVEVDDDKWVLPRF